MAREIIIENVNECNNEKLPVMEIFSSIQGEGMMIGMPVTFIRLAGCNLRCPWCDTKESWVKPDEDSDLMDLYDEFGNRECNEKERHDFMIATKGYDWMTVEEIVQLVDKDVAVITGGEPCMHNLNALIEMLHLNEVMVNIETNGTLETPPNADWIVCSPKPGNEHKIHEKCFAGEYKFVVTPEFTIDDIPEDLKMPPYGRIWLQPEGGNMEEMWKKCVELTMKYPFVRTGIQLHKVINVK